VSDRVFALAWLGACIMIIFQMWHLDVPFAYEPVGPRAFPLLLAMLMAICCVAMLVSPDQGIQWPETPLLRRGAALVTVLLGYAFSFEWLGFSLATAAMTFVVARIFGGRLIPGMITALAIGVIGYLFFDRLLQVSLPPGRIWG
jgi:putative tricarboxylic transport membrane protein